MQEFRFWPTSPPRQLGGIFELRSYTLNPGTLLEWETHWQKGLAARREVMEGVGGMYLDKSFEFGKVTDSYFTAWFAQIGALNQVHHLWQFADLEERRSRREQSWGVQGWADTVSLSEIVIFDTGRNPADITSQQVHKTVPLIQNMQSRIMVPMPWSPIG